MLLRQYQMLADTQAAGERQSGPAVIMEFENTGAEATMTVRGMNRFQFRPWGVRGGEAGRLGRVILNPDTAAKDIGKINVLQLKRGDVVRLLSPAGGGFGDPLQRDPALVERDVRAGLVSRTRALGVYGVALDTHGKVDGNATAAERLQRPRPAGAAPAFSLGAEREAYDRIWPDAVRSALAREAMKQEPSVRHLLLSRVRDRLTEEGRPVDPALLERTMAEELSALGGAPAPSSAERRARSGRNT